MRPFVVHPFYSRVVLVLLAGCLYANSLGGGFVWDDTGLVAGNTQTSLAPESLPEIFTAARFGPTPYYRPLLDLSFCLDALLWGGRPLGYHLTNVCLHAACTLLVLAFAGGVGLSRRTAFFTAALFAVHPAHTEAVAWIAGRNDPLMVFWLLAAFVCLLSARSCPVPVRQAGWCAASLAAFACALLSKETAIVFPALLALTDFFFFRAFWRPPARQATLLYWGAVLGLLAGFLALRATVLGTSGAAGLSLRAGDAVPALWSVLGIVGRYVRVLVFPIHLSVSPAPMPQAEVALFLTAGLAALGAMLALPRRRVCLYGVLWVVVCLLPVSGLVQMVVPVLEHRLYGAVPGFCLAMAAVATDLAAVQTGRFRRVVQVAAAGVLLCWGLVTVDRNRVWKDNLSLWRDTVQKHPASAFAHNNLGVELIRRGAYAAAVAPLQQARDLVPASARVQENLCLALLQARMLEQAREACAEAIARDPRSAVAHSRLGQVLERMGDMQSAVQCYREAVEQNPLFVEAYLHHAALLERLGKREETRAMYAAGLARVPRSADLHNAAGLFYAAGNETAQARSHFLAAIQSDPARYEPLNNLALLNIRLGEFSRAAGLCRRAIALRPDSAELYLNYGICLFNLGQLPEAVQAYDRALALAPDRADAHFNTAVALLALHRVREARGHFKLVLKYSPRYPDRALVEKMLKQLSEESDLQGHKN